MGMSCRVRSIHVHACDLEVYCYIGSGLSVCLLGVAYFANIHKLYYFIIIQIFGGMMQVCMDGWMGWDGWEGCMGEWVGGWMDGGVDGWVGRWMDGWVDKWIDGCMNG